MRSQLAKLPAQLSERSFYTLRDLFERECGIRLQPEKKMLVISRLQRRLELRGLNDFEAYCALVCKPQEADERALMVDALTTHETFFFRAPDQFRHLVRHALPSLERKPVRVWSAAASTGEEAYSIAMSLADAVGWDGWEVLGSDISARVVWHATRGLFPLARLNEMPEAFLRKFCLKGVGDYSGQLLVNAQLRAKTAFFRHNLLGSAEGLGLFDIVFLRNVLIYFDQAKRRQILDNVLSCLRPGGYLYIGHAETPCDTISTLKQVGQSVWRSEKHSNRRSPGGQS